MDAAAAAAARVIFIFVFVFGASTHKHSYNTCNGLFGWHPLKKRQVIGKMSFLVVASIRKETETDVFSTSLSNRIQHPKRKKERKKTVILDSMQSWRCLRWWCIIAFCNNNTTTTTTTIQQIHHNKKRRVYHSFKISRAYPLPKQAAAAATHKKRKRKNDNSTYEWFETFGYMHVVTTSNRKRKMRCVFLECTSFS